FICLIFNFLITPISLVADQTSHGEKIYHNECADCHDGGFWGWLSGAPSIKEQSEWTQYLKKDFEEILQAAIKGTEDGMDPKGGCDECTDEEIRQSVEYMLKVLDQ
ncbi:MAG: c-type cytochrome, partial [SAR324 cluster bacterium]|nr:c-type cytochrome [SAR324 cluster bacterium]